MDDLAPRVMLERMLHRWWILALLMVMGGVGGWSISYIQPPIYEATVIYNVSLDQQKLVEEGVVASDKLPLDFASQNVYLLPADEMFTSPDVEAHLAMDANAPGLLSPKNTIDPENLSLDRNGLAWQVSVRSVNPSVAARLANFWVKEADSALRAAQVHTLQSESLGIEYASIQKCFLDMDFTQANICAGTSFVTSSDLDAYLINLEQKILSEQQAGHGIDPALSFMIMTQAQPPSHPILYAVSSISLAGSLVGLLIGILLVQILPARGHRL